MPSNRPKLQGYVDAEIHKAFTDWKIEQGIEGDSQALTELLKQFFGFERPALGMTREQIEELIDQKLAAFEEKIRRDSEITDNPPQSEEPIKKPPLTIPLTGLKQSELEQRLKLAKGILTRRREKADFREWSQRQDPQNIAWQYDAIARKYLAVE